MLIPDEIVAHVPEKCPNDGMNGLVVKKCENNVLTDIPLIIEVLTKLHRIYACRCNNCDLVGIEPETISRGCRTQAEDVYITTSPIGTTKFC